MAPSALCAPPALDARHDAARRFDGAHRRRQRRSLVLLRHAVEPGRRAALPLGLGEWARAVRGRRLDRSRRRPDRQLRRRDPGRSTNRLADLVLHRRRQRNFATRLVARRRAGADPRRTRHRKRVRARRTGSRHRRFRLARTGGARRVQSVRVRRAARDRSRLLHVPGAQPRRETPAPQHRAGGRQGPRRSLQRYAHLGRSECRAARGWPVDDHAHARHGFSRRRNRFVELRRHTRDRDGCRRAERSARAHHAALAVSRSPLPGDRGLRPQQAVASVQLAVARQRRPRQRRHVRLDAEWRHLDDPRCAPRRRDRGRQRCSRLHDQQRAARDLRPRPAQPHRTARVGERVEPAIGTARGADTLGRRRARSDPGGGRGWCRARVSRRRGRSRRARGAPRARAGRDCARCPRAGPARGGDRRQRVELRRASRRHAAICVRGRRPRSSLRRRDARRGGLVRFTRDPARKRARGTRRPDGRCVGRRARPRIHAWRCRRRVRAREQRRCEHRLDESQSRRGVA